MPLAARTAARPAVAVVCGAAVGLAFPPVGLWVLLLPGLVGAVGVLHGQSPRRGALLGMCFGTAYMAVLLPWVRVIGPDAYVALTLLEALFYAAWGWAAVRVQVLSWWPVATAGLWAVAELARSHVPFTGFPWGKVAFALADTPLQAYVRYVGVPALGALVVLCAALVWWGWLAVRARPAPAVGSWVAVGGVLLVGALLPVGLAGGSGTVRVAAVQGGIPGTGADGLGEQREVVTNHVRATEAYAADVAAGTADPADVVIWPENSTDIDPFTDPRSYAAIEGAVAAVDVPLLVGALIAGEEADRRRNVGLVWSPESGPGDVYVKQNLVPFGEYVPLRDLLAPLIGRLDQIPRDFEAGDEAGVLDLGPVVVGDAMCYDVAYEGVVAPAVQGGAELLVVQTNNATYRATGQPEQQWAISRLRALEAGRDLVVASTNGISGIVAADGTVLARSSGSGPQVLTATVGTASGRTPAVRFGAWFAGGAVGVGLLAVGTVLGTSLRARRRDRSTSGPGRGPGADDDPYREPVGVGAPAPRR